MDNLMQISIKAREIADIIDGLDEEMAKWVLRIFVYDRK